MAKRETYEDCRHKTPGCTRVVGSFRPNGSNPLDSTNYNAGVNPTGITGKGYSVVRQGVGTFRVTIPGSYRSIVGFDCSVQMAAGSLPAGPVDLTWALVSGATPGTSAIVIDITYRVSNAAADIASAVGSRIHFMTDLESGR